MTKEKLDLFEVIRTASEDHALLDAFLEDILSPKEYAEIIKRWQIILKLHEGVDQRSIAEQLKVSISKVTRGSLELQDEAGGFAQILNK